MPNPAARPDAKMLAKIAELREEERMSNAALPGRAAPPPPPYKSPEVEVLSDRFVGGKKGDKLRLTGFSQGEVEALIEAGAIRLTAQQRPSVAGMKEDNDG